MAVIPFTQYLRPHGEARAEQIVRPDDVVALANQLIDQGVVFECEELRTGHIALYARDRLKDDSMLAVEIVDNGPEVEIAIDRLVRTAAERATS